MLPTLGGKSDPVKFIHKTGAPRFLINLDGLFGGDGLGATIGGMPSLSHFPTDTLDSKMIVLPAGIWYTVIDPSIAVVESKALE